MLKPRLCDYSDAYILVTGIISVASIPAADFGVNNTNIIVACEKSVPHSKHVELKQTIL